MSTSGPEMSAVPPDYHCDGYKHTYTGMDEFFLYGSSPCPEYPTCRSEAAINRSEGDEHMDEFEYSYEGIVTTGERLLADDSPPVDLMNSDILKRLTERLTDIDPQASLRGEPEIAVEAIKVPEPATTLSQTFSVLGDVAEERQKQETKWGQQNHDDLMWSAILAEEVGESAQEVLTQVWGKETGHGHGDLRAELVQVAAVAVAWIEAVDRRNAEG